MAELDPMVQAALQRHGTSADEVEVLDCDPDAADTAVFCERYGIDPNESANAIVVIGKDDPPRYVCCVVLATTRLDVNGAVRKRMSVRKASFAPGEVTTELTGMMIGGVTPIGMPSDVPVWIDAAVMARDSIVIGGGNRSSKLRLAPSTLLGATDGTVVEDLAKPIDG